MLYLVASTVFFTVSLGLNVKIIVFDLTQEWRDRKSGDGVNLRMGYAPLTQLDLGSPCLDFKLEEETILQILNILY